MLHHGATGPVAVATGIRRPGYPMPCRFACRLIERLDDDAETLFRHRTARFRVEQAVSRGRPELEVQIDPIAARTARIAFRPSDAAARAKAADRSVGKRTLKQPLRFESQGERGARVDDVVSGARERLFRDVAETDVNQR